ncbi:MAG TPA: TonB-dependent receptor [Gemmatimonadaceae bacterium]|nr:TonB-dependent receptor [Gemmatimonadaceae bacterium]
MSFAQSRMGDTMTHVFITIGVFLFLSNAAALADPVRVANADITGVVTDAGSGQPLPSAEVSIMQGTQVIANASTDAFGRYTAHNLAAGTYDVTARFLGFSPQSKSITIGDNNADVRVDFSLTAVAISLQGVTVTAAVPLAVDTRSGDQRFKQDQYHGAPTNTTSQILQQSIAGAARAPTGEVHIRGQHAEYTYYVDGVPVPSGISGSLNELFEPSVVNEIDFKTGGWDAEYGGKNAAIVDITTRIPTGGLHYQASGFAGNYNTYGQGLSASTNAGKLGYFFSGSHQTTDMRREPVILDPASNEVENFHNHGEDWFGFGKVQYTPSLNDVFNLEVNLSQTKFQVPFDTTGNTQLDDNQRDVNSFVNLGWRHQFAGPEYSSGGSAANAGGAPEMFTGLFYRHGSLTYTPGATDQPQFVFFPDPNPYNITELRNFNTYGLKADYSIHPAHELEFKVGTLSSITRGHEDFSTFDASGNRGPASNSDLKGWDAGGYAQVAWSPVERFEIRTGVRYDAHNAPFAGTQTQWSPRVRLNFFPNSANTLYLYYGRLFLPTNVEDLRSITSVAQGGTATEPTLPERDHFYEAGAIHRFPFGLVSKFSGYYKESTPGIDDNTVPGSAIVTSVNIAKAKIAGIETVQEIRPPGPFSAYLNAALNHAYGRGPITGGFFPTDEPTGFFDLDHDQRLSVLGSATYSLKQSYFSLTGVYGSGLTNGVDPADCNCDYGTSLFDFNKGIKVKPSFILNGSTGISFTFGRALIRPEFYVDNILDKKYLLKGAFFSGASVGRPRMFQLRLNIAQ